jgi:hypothetical protein
MRITARRSVLWAAVAVSVTASLLCPPAAVSATRNDPYPLHAHSQGQHVKDLQWLLGGHKPNVFTKVKPTFKFKPNGSYGARTKAAVKAYRYRLGAPMSQLDNPVGLHFIYLLEGKAHRPPSWIANASHRVKAVEPGATAAALKIRAYETSQLGVHEVPLGSNWGPTVRLYQTATGAFHAAWCVSFQQYASLISGFGTFADRTASVYYELDYYAARNRVFAKPKVGALVAFVTYRYGRRVAGTGHTGFVAKVTASGFVSIEGNQANGVHEIFHPWQDTGRTWSTTAFIYRHGIA